MTNPNERKFYDQGYIGKIILDDTQENILTNIKVKEEQRGNGYSRDILQEWLSWCFSNGYAEAYVVNIKSDIIDYVLDTLRGYKTEEIRNHNVPYKIVSGHTISDRAYRIEPR